MGRRFHSYERLDVDVLVLLAMEPGADQDFSQPVSRLVEPPAPTMTIKTGSSFAAVASSIEPSFISPDDIYWYGIKTATMLVSSRLPQEAFARVVRMACCRTEAPITLLRILAHDLHMPEPCGSFTFTRVASPSPLAAGSGGLSSGRRGPIIACGFRHESNGHWLKCRVRIHFCPRETQTARLMYS